MVGALCTEAEVVVRPLDGEAFLDEHVDDVKVVALRGEHHGGYFRGKAGTAFFLVIEAMLKLQLHPGSLVGVHGVTAPDEKDF